MRKSIPAIVVAISLMFFVSPVSAALWNFYAESILTDDYFDFSIVFNDEDNDNEVDIEDVVGFSGYTIPVPFAPIVYEELVGLSDTTVGGLTLTGTPYVIGSGFFSYTSTETWQFRDTDGGLPDLVFPDPVPIIGTALYDYSATMVPLPAAVWLCGSGLVGLAVLRKRMKS